MAALAIAGAACTAQVASANDVGIAATAAAVVPGPAAGDAPPAAFAAPQAAWVAAWGAAMMVPADKYALKERGDTTLRQIVRLSTGGNAVRVRLSNVHGDAPLVIDAATFAPAQAGSDKVEPAALQALRFGGEAGITLAPGKEALSDPLPFDAGAGRDVAVSLHLVSAPAKTSGLQAAHSTQYTAPGNQVAAAGLETPRNYTSWYFLTGVEVAAQHPPASPVLVAIGDSLTNGSGSGVNRNERWTDWLARRAADGKQPPMAVVNAGIGGNTMFGNGTGPTVMARFERDVLQRPGVTHAVVLIGVNDLGRLRKGGKETPATSAELIGRMQAGWRELAARAHAQGICFVAGTLMPYGGSNLYKPEAHNEADRLALNDWLRKAADFDAVADFDAAVRDPVAPEKLLAAYDSGDHLHLSPAGYRAMAQAVPLDKLAGCKRVPPAPAASSSSSSPAPAGAPTL